MAAFAGRYGPDNFPDRRGNRLLTTVFTVYEADGTTPSSLWSDRTKLVALANPLPVGVIEDSDWSGLSTRGNLAFYANPGPHVIVGRVDGVEVGRFPIDVGSDARQVTPETGTAAELASANPTLLAGQEGIAIDTGVRKVGPGTWNALPSYVPRQDPVRAQSTNQVAGQTTQTAELLTLPAPVVVGAIPWVGHLHLPTLFGSIAGNILHVEITDLSNVPKSQRDWTIPLANEIDGLDLYERITTPGPHQRKVRISRLTGAMLWGYGAADNEYVQFLEYHQEP